MLPYTMTTAAAARLVIKRTVSRAIATAETTARQVVVVADLGKVVEINAVVVVVVVTKARRASSTKKLVCSGMHPA
jgi:hypothetical protein